MKRLLDFKSLFEKIKSIDKKILIAGVIAVVLVVAVIIVLVVTLGDEPTGAEQDGTETENTLNTEIGTGETESETETETELESDTEPETEASTDADSETEEETDAEPVTDSYYNNEPNNSNQQNPSGNGSEDGGQTANQQTPTNNSSGGDGGEVTTEPPTVTNPDGEEIIGAGSAGQPYLEIPGSDMTVTTVSIPAGKSVHYDIYRVGGMYFTINDANAYVIYEGTRYDAINGKVSFKVGNALASDAVSFEIGNKGSSAASFTISFTNPTGSFANPTAVNTLGGDVTVSLAEGIEVGHYYKYYAEKTGKIRFYMTATVDSVMLVTNNRNSAQRTSEADALTDEQGRQYIELEVNQGDELIINVGAKPNKRGKYPATEITWRGEFN